VTIEDLDLAICGFEHRLLLVFVEKVRVGAGQYFEWIERGSPLRENVLESISYPLLLASKTSFNEQYAKPLRAPTLICFPCCAIFALQ
jgi:hypothetical protein